jgi:hypothetical protein
MEALSLAISMASMVADAVKQIVRLKKDLVVVSNVIQQVVRNA